MPLYQKPEKEERISKSVLFPINLIKKIDKNIPKMHRSKFICNTIETFFDLLPILEKIKNEDNITINELIKKIIKNYKDE